MKLSAQEEMILCVLYHDELAGLEIIDAVEEISAGKHKIGLGSLYVNLNRLEKNNLVKSRWSKERYEERGGARKRLYSLTDDGKKTLREIESNKTGLWSWQPGLA